MSDDAEVQPATSQGIEVRIAALQAELKVQDRDVSDLKLELHRAESRRDETKRQLAAWTAALEPIKKAGL